MLEESEDEEAVVFGGVDTRVDGCVETRAAEEPEVSVVELLLRSMPNQAAASTTTSPPAAESTDFFRMWNIISREH